MSPLSRRQVIRDAGGALAGASVVGATGGAARTGAVPGAAPTRTDRSAGAADASTGSQTTPMVEFDAQQVERGASRVTVERAVLPDGGFVVVHEGELSGPIIGYAGSLPPGVHRHVEVELESRLTGLTKLTAMLFRDSDGDGVLDFTANVADDPYLLDGQPVYDAAPVFAPTPTPEPSPTRTRTPSPSPTPTASPSPSPTATEASDGIPGFGVVAGLVAAGAGAVGVRMWG